MKKTNVETKSTELTSVLNGHFKGKTNRCRIKFISMFVLALCKVQAVGFEKLANAFDTKAKAESSHRRIQHFIASYIFDSDIFPLMFKMLAKRGNSNTDDIQIIRFLSCT